ncbi:hypothetical protein ACGFNU_05760 [Spirillospora sp. NPDC048911]|uniref:hypothetical protein n=1 Tax=Spirillospora sp. NPDC048911 TaxID=3364527 RepID=UPI0037171E89
MAANTASADTSATAPATSPTPAADVPATAPTVPADTVAPGAPEGAVWDALTANPGATVAVIAKAAGVKSGTARNELAALADAGHATCTPGEKGRNGRRQSDTWTPAETDSTTDTDANAGADADAGTVTEPVAEPTGDASTDTPATDGDDTEDDEDAELVAPVVDADMIAEAMRVMAEEGERRAVADAEIKAKLAEEEARRATILAELESAQRTEATRRALTDLLAAVTTTYAAVVAGDESATDAGLERVFAATNGVAYATGAAVVRSAKPRTGGGHGGTGGGSRAGRAAPRPLRPEVLAHLQAYPGKEFTPGEIGKVLDRSSGAVANALDKLVELGDAAMTTDKPARYSLNSTATATDGSTSATAPASAPRATTDGTDTPAVDGATGDAGATDAAA